MTEREPEPARDPDVLDLLEQARRRNNGKARPARGQGGARPTIELRIGETRRCVDELESLLIAADLGLYQRGGVIVSTGSAVMRTWDRKIVITTVITARGDHALAEDAEAVAKFIRFDKKGERVPCRPPDWLILTLKDRLYRLRFPVLVGIVNCPSISVEGELLDRPGYDPQTGILYDPEDALFPPVPSNPTREQAEKAMARVALLIETFDLVGKPDRAVALSFIFTMVARRGLPFVPLHGFDAPVAGSGKSKIVDIGSILATGHEAGVTDQGNHEELKKCLAAILMRGDQLVAIDNCDAPLEGALLNQMLTQSRVSVRILEFSTMVDVQPMAVVSATGNNLALRGDLIRRSIIAKLDPGVERPELREFSYDPIDDAKKNRGELVAAVLTVLRAYSVAGRPARPTPTLQGFTQWSDTVRGALIWLGQGDPVATMQRLRENDPVLANMRAVLIAWRNQFGDLPVSTAEAIDTANKTLPPNENSARPYAYSKLREALIAVAGRGDRIEARSLGRWLGRHAGRIVDLGDIGKPDFARIEAGPLLDGNQRWCVKKPR